MKLFTAIRINSGDAEELCRFAKASLDSEIELAEDLHITLQYIGEYADVNDILCRMAGVAYKPFELTYNRINTFVNMPDYSNVIWQGIEDAENNLQNLYEITKKALYGIKLAADCISYKPHITLSYTQKEIDLNYIAELNSPLKGKTFSVREFELCEVLDDDCRPKFRTIGKFRLDEHSVRISVNLVWVNDLHGAISPKGSDPGISRLVSSISDFISRNPNTEVLFGGDNFFGDPVSDLYKGIPVAEAMKALHVKASVLGNHDFDLAKQDLANCSYEGGFRFISANLHPRTLEFCDESMVLNIAGFRVGILGLSTSEPLAGPDHPKCWDNYKILESHEVVSQFLLSSDCDVNIAATHYGLKETASCQLIGEEALDLIHIENGFDAVLTAHLHQVLQFTCGKTAVLQAGCHGRYFGVVRFTFNENHDLLSVIPLVYPVDINVQENEEIREKVEQYKINAGKILNRQVGFAQEKIPHRRSDFRIPYTGTALTKMATDCMTGVSACPIAFVYSGRVGFSGFNQGEITLYDFDEQFPFKNSLVTLSLSGKQIRVILESGFRTADEGLPSPIAVGGLRFSLNPDQPEGERISGLMNMEGNPIEDDTYYPVVTENYLVTDPFGIPFSCGKDIVYHEENLHALMLKYFQEYSPVKNLLPTNIIIERRK